MNKDTFYVTTPIYYPNDELHIGHTYTTTAADTITKFKELQGYETEFITGSDEHGQKLQQAAQEHDMEPLEYIDGIVDSFKDLWDQLQVDYTEFVRTTSSDHKADVQHIFEKLYEQGDIYKDKYEGYYCTPCETFWQERELNEDGNCPDCDRDVEWMEEESYFFKMSQYEEQLLDFLESNPDFIQPTRRRKEMINFIEDGLDDLCISRASFDWGVPVPIDDDHVIYVWFDALISYLTGIGFQREDKFSDYWPADVHIVGKDILRFHTIIWPSILMAADMPLPKQVFGHGFLLVEGGKMSKSKGNVIDPSKLIDDFGVDAVRYYLLREIAFGADGSYSTESFIQRINSDLANDLGNLLNRTIAMVEKYFDGQIPAPGEETEYDAQLEELAQEVFTKVEENMDQLQFSTALEELWRLVRRTNKYIDQTEPWVLAKDESQQDKLATILYTLLDNLRRIAISLVPFLPEAPAKMWQQIGISAKLEEQTWEDVKAFGQLEPGTKVQAGDPIFPRIDIEEYYANLDEADTTAVEEDNKEEAEMTEDNYISFDEFGELDLRVAEVLEVEEIEGSDKLLKVQVELGAEQRQLVAGISNHYQPEELEGKKVVMIANMEPATIFGVESNGMILAASNDEDELTVTTVDRDIASGAKVK